VTATHVGDGYHGPVAFVGRRLVDDDGAVTVITDHDAASVSSSA